MTEAERFEPLDPELDREYSPSSAVGGDISEFITRYAEDSAATRDTTPHMTLAFGAGPDDLVDLFPARNGALLHVHIHGGYWQQLSRRDASFHADNLVNRRVHFASVEYTLAPEAPLPDIVDQVVRALRFLRDYVRDAEGHPVPLLVSGHSAGAHLATMAAIQMAPGSISGLALVSGIWDLRPLLATTINDAVGMDHEVADAMSPMPSGLDGDPTQRSTHRPIPTIAVVGEIETDTFIRNNADFADAWQQAGHPTEAATIEGRNHFDIVHDLTNARTELGRMLRTLERQVLLPQ